MIDDRERDSDMEMNKVAQAEIVTMKLYSEDDLDEDEEYAKIAVGVSSVIGTRKSQQDTVFAQFSDETGIAVVCDGMGGLQGGERASEVAATTLARDFFEKEKLENIPRFFEEEAYRVDEIVSRLTDENGALLEAGTTLISVIIKQNLLYWLSIGDSKIYIIRNNEIVTVNRMHNYRMTMDQMLQEGTMTLDEYQEKEHHAEALISFVGMGNVSLMDINDSGFVLKDKDRILLASDGLYRILSDEMIVDILNMHLFDIQEAANELTGEAVKRAVKSQDNTSLVLIQYNEEMF